MKILILFLSFNLFLLESAFSKQIIGYAKVIDADTIYIDSYKIRLEGIDAPEIKQKCILNQKEYFCGLFSKNKLKEKVDAKIIKCISSGKDRYKRYLATCFAGKIDLNKWLVKNGYAIAYRKYSKLYVDDEKFAKKNNLGLWSGTFIEPEKWRKLN